LDIGCTSVLFWSYRENIIPKNFWSGTYCRPALFQVAAALTLWGWIVDAFIPLSFLFETGMPEGPQTIIAIVTHGAFMASARTAYHLCISDVTSRRQVFLWLGFLSVLTSPRQFDTV